MKGQRAGMEGRGDEWIGVHDVKVTKNQQKFFKKKLHQYSLGYHQLPSPAQAMAVL